MSVEKEAAMMPEKDTKEYRNAKKSRATTSQRPVVKAAEQHIERHIEAFKALAKR